MLLRSRADRVLASPSTHRNRRAQFRCLPHLRRLATWRVELPNPIPFTLETELGDIRPPSVEAFPDEGTWKI